MELNTRSLAVLLAALVAACGDPVTSEDDAGAGVDAPLSGDGDHDGVPASMDCDDANPSVGTSSTRSCDSSCGSGTQACASGVWGACSAPTDCSCSTEGAIRTAACGMCGQLQQTCTGGAWTATSACLNEGECLASAIETDPAMCGMRTRLCDATCHWGPWDVMTPVGECDAGATRTTSEGCPTGQSQPQTCDSGCHWMSTGACAWPCVRAPNPSMSGADPVCIPAGDSILGSDIDGPNTIHPTRQFSFTEFYIDRYPVTHERYEMCVSAGGCPASTASGYASGRAVDVAVLRHAEAVAFCMWDGGELMTEFQYTRAGRGDAPDARLHAWGDDRGACEMHPDPDDLTCARLSRVDLTAFPSNVSPFGVHFLGALVEHTRERWLYTNVWPADIATTDPVLNGTGAAWTMVGVSVWTNIGFPVGYSSLAYRTSAAVGSAEAVVRCVY